MRVEKLCMAKILMVGIDPILQWQCKSPLPPKKLISQLKLTLAASWLPKELVSAPKRLKACKLAVQINLKFISKIISVFLCVQFLKT